MSIQNNKTKDKWMFMSIHIKSIITFLAVFVLAAFVITWHGNRNLQYVKITSPEELYADAVVLFGR